MAIVGFNFSRIVAQHKKASKGNVKIGTNIKIDSLQKTNLVFDEKRATLKASFTYAVTYDPSVGDIELQGDILFMQEAKIVAALLKEWEEKKTVPKKLSAILMNHIMQKCTVQALVMARDIGLPAPVPLPKIKQQAAPKAAEKEAPAKKK